MLSSPSLERSQNKNEFESQSAFAPGLIAPDKKGPRVGTRSVVREQYSRPIKLANYELKVGLGAESHGRLVSVRRLYAGLENIQGRHHRYAKTFRKG